MKTCLLLTPLPAVVALTLSCSAKSRDFEETAQVGGKEAGVGDTLDELTTDSPSTASSANHGSSSTTQSNTGVNTASDSNPGTATPTSGPNPPPVNPTRTAATDAGVGEVEVDVDASAPTTPTTDPTGVSTDTGTDPDPIPQGECGALAYETGAVCEGQCGNGSVDSCTQCYPTFNPGFDPVSGPPPGLLDIAPPEPICQELTEQCDGTVSGEQTCAGLGFTGGVLGCADTCVFDEARCESCGNDDHILKCRDDLSVGKHPSRVALATNESEAAIAWQSDAARLEFAVFDANLNKRGEASCVSDDVTSLSLAPLPSGWVLSAGSKRFIMASDGTIGKTLDTPMGSALFTAHRPGAAPLLVWQADGGSSAMATLVDNDGNDVWTSEVTSDTIEAQYGSAAATSDGFLVALRAGSGDGVHVYHLNAAGEVTGSHMPGSTSTEYPQLAVSGDTVRLVWADFSGSPTVYWAKLDTNGERVGEPVVIGTTPDYFNRSPIAIDGEDTLVLFGGYTGGTGIGAVHNVRRIDSSGATLYGDYPVQSDPNTVAWPQLAPFDTGFIAAWVGYGQPGRIGLAHLAP